MKINKLHIIAFGGLKDFTIEFKDGLNCIFGENENGKSTVMAFLKMMFYGSERGSGLAKNMRKKYSPWDGSQMAGTVEFEHNGKNYRLEREFRSSNSTDRVSLIDIALGEKQVVSPDIGVQLFSLSASAFERSLFIGQLGFPSSDNAAESELNARLSNMITTGDEKISLEQVQKRIEKARFNILSKSGKAGIYSENASKLAELEKEYKDSVNAQNEYLEATKRLIEHKKQTATLAKRLEELKIRLYREKDFANKANFRALLDTKAELENYRKKLLLKDGSLIDTEYLRRVEFCANKKHEAEQKLETETDNYRFLNERLENAQNSTPQQLQTNTERLTESIKNITDDLEQRNNKISYLQAKLAEARNKQTNQSAVNGSFNPLLLCLSVLMLVLSPVLFKLSGLVLGAVFAAIGIILFILSFVFKPVNKAKSKDLSKHIEQIEITLCSEQETASKLNDDLITRKAELQALLNTQNVSNNLLDVLKKDIEDSENVIKTLKNKLELALTDYNEILAKAGISPVDDVEVTIEKYKTSCEKVESLKRELTSLSKVLGNISYEDAENKLKEIEDISDYSGESFEDIKKEYDSLQERIKAAESEEASFAAQMNHRISSVKNPDALQKEIDEIKGTLTQQKDFCDSLDLAIEVLQESFAILRKSYGSELEKATAEIFKTITDGKYDGITVSKSFEIQVEESKNPISRESEYLSSGANDQAYLSLRLAVAKSICPENKPLLFMDDSLTQYDDNRTKRTIEFLKNYAKDGQILLFTCHNSVADMVLQSGSFVTNIRK